MIKPLFLFINTIVYATPMGGELSRQISKEKLSRMTPPTKR